MHKNLATEPNNKSYILSVLEKANQIASMTSLDDLLDQMLELMIEVSGSNVGTLYLLDRDVDELVFKVVKGDAADKELVGMRMSSNLGIVGAAIRQSCPIIIEDLANDPRWYRDVSEKSSHLYNAITFPLLLHGKPIGAVQIFNFTHSELELLQTLGNRMASEIDKVLLLERVRCSNSRLKTLVELLGKIGATLDRDELLSLVAESASSFLDAEHSTLFLIDPTTGAFLVPPSERDCRDSQNSINPPYIKKASMLNSISARSTLTVPLRTRPISVGQKRSVLEERIIGNLLVINKRLGNFNDEDTQLVEILASQASTVLQIAELYAEADELFIDFLKALAATIDAKDPYTRGHSQRVSNISMAIANQLNLNPDIRHALRVGSLLHDVGKIGVPDTIITKPDILTKEEKEQMARHPSIGFQIIKQVHLLENVLPAILEHHERLDGGGYPLGLAGEQITLMGRIVAVADVYDAMTTDRPYRKAMEIEVVLGHLQEKSDIAYDRCCVNALISALEDGSCNGLLGVKPNENRMRR